MLQIKNISKQYKTGSLVQMALNDVSLNLRDNEFISILGPSGSGKTTLLNIIGGLDRYDSGDMIIDGVSTKKYHSKAWDSYRNHTIGFVFQSYNLIPHQTVLANVELALTIGGVSAKERRKRAEDALREVGLEEHLHKRPNQLSGGQMQRVAIARALVNDPKILLADEPTGALDTETGIQVMEILKKVAEKRLVVMVTHNPELAEQYSTRIVKLRDGKIVDDSNPFVVEENTNETKTIKYAKSKMSFLTSLSLSFNNLRTKKARTLITSIAGSIGIIGIALILAMSNGVNIYVQQIQREAMESYPITIDSVAYVYDDSDFYIVNDDTNKSDENTAPGVEGKVVPVVNEADDNNFFVEPIEKKNNLSAFKEYLEKPENNVDKYIGTGSIISVYDTRFLAYTKDVDGNLINTSNFLNIDGTFSAAYTYIAEGFIELAQGRDGTISKKTKNSYELIYGDWPEHEDECIIITDNTGGIDARTLCQLGYISSEDYIKLVNNPDLASDGSLGAVTYEDICKKEFTVLPASFRYEKNANGTYSYIEDSSNKITDLIDKNGIKLKITGIVKQLDNNGMGVSIDSYFFGGSQSVVGYTYKLTNKIIDLSLDCDVVKAQLDDTTKSVTTGLPFNIKSEQVIVNSVREYMSQLSEEEKISYATYYIDSSDPVISVGGGSSAAEAKDPVKLFDSWLEKATDRQLIEVYNSHLYWNNNLESTLSEIGYVSYDSPSQIVIYPDTFEGKQGIMQLLDDYNATASENDQITYYDYIKELTDQISEIINTVSWILIAFVAVSLVVSCIMIGIITHISVLERTKEIGILRALGASKKNISQVFNAETFIIGLLSGIIGVGIAALLCIPANAIIAGMGIIENGVLTISVPIIPAIILIVISTFITMIGGFIPAKSASRKDPVIALRTE